MVRNQAPAMLPKPQRDLADRILGFVLGFAVAATIIVLIWVRILSAYW